MCIKKILTFALCGHSGATNPNLIFIVSDDCPTKDCEDPVEQTEFHPDEKCFECIGVEAFRDRYDGPPVFYKHCFQSEICDHEYEHMATDIPRDPYADEIVLVTPIHHEICPECKANGFDRKPGGTNPPPKTPSVMPRDFEGLPRADMASVRPSLNPGTSRAPAATYNPGASRVHTGSKYSTKVGRDILPTLDDPRLQNGSKATVAGGSRTLFHSPDTPRGLPTVVYTPPSAQQHLKAPTEKPPMTAADYLKRGVPKNVAKSGFYDNVDGEVARANLGMTSKAPSSQAPRSGTTARPSHAPGLGIANRSASDSDSPFHSSTVAPPADAPSADLEKELAGLTITPKSVAPQTNHRRQTVESVKPGEGPSLTVRPSSTSKPSTRPGEYPSASRIAPPPRSPSGNSVYPSHVPPSVVPASTSRPTVASGSSTSKSPHHGSQSMAPSSQASSTHRSSASHSTAPRDFTIPSTPPSTTPQTALPQYRTMEPSRSAFPSKAPPR